MRGTILLVDDEERILKTLARALRDDGHDVFVTASPIMVQSMLAERDFDLMIVDNRMPEISGLELIRTVVETSVPGDRPEMVMMTAHATVDSAIEAMRLGAFDYLQKPFEVDELLVVAGKALEHRRLRNEHRYLLSEQKTEFNNYGIVGTSAAIRAVIEKLGQVAQSKSTVLITGETGTGKELAARAIHDRSAERGMPLIKVNCAAIPETLLESELFGHVKGSFTSATTNKKGKFTLAHGGSIFLDEIGMLGQPLQAKLHRVLQEREFEPLGSERTESVDVRVIAATNRDLRKMIAAGEFQEDLYYRLSVIPIELPPLRSRREDIPALVAHFVGKHRRRTGKHVERVSDEALEKLCAYDWPGNVRELENTIERAVVLTRVPVIGLEELSLTPSVGARREGLPSQKLHKNIEWAERESISRALEQAKGLKKGAAEILGISQRALSYYLKKFDFD
ncbi:MAG TPA: sigma-54 dependent transcriptional regulator [Vicinamibacteria bacterium]|nr:sigma-54 dependent transcriptional regulator [Vicinamibacteria bacterium]